MSTIFKKAAGTNFKFLKGAGRSIFRVISSSIDEFSNYLVLLLHMDGANESQSFVDSSTNNFIFTVDGGAQINSAQTKFGGGAGYFGPNDDYLTASSSPLFGFGTGDFTIEMWIYPQGTNSFQGFFNANNYTNGILMRWHANSTTDPLYINGTAYDWEPAINAPVNTWSHLALVRYGGIVKMFVNGVNTIGSVTNNSDLGSSAVPLIGASAHNTNEGFNGYIDELRVTKGVARYTSNFTPPTKQFSNPSDPHGENVSLLLHMDESSRDLVAFWQFNENNTTPSVGNPSYFLTNAGGITYSTGKVGGGINLSIGSRIRVNENLWDMVASPTSYSVAFWVKKNNSSGSPQSAIIAGSVFGPMNFYFSFGTVVNGTQSSFENGITYGTVTGATQYTYLNAPFSVNLGEWVHVVGTYDLSTSTRKLYVNGNLIATQNGITPPTSVQHYSWNGFAINGSTVGTNRSEYGGNHSFDAFGLWSRALTNTEIAELYNNGNGKEYSYLTDSSLNDFTVTPNGNAQISTSVKKFGNGAALFDGNGDYLELDSPSDNLIDWFSTDYTLECWVYIISAPSNTPSQSSPLIGNADISSSIEYWSFGPTNSLSVKFKYWSGQENSLETSSSVLNLNQWYHLALVKNGTSLSIYIDGSKVVYHTLANSPLISNSYPLAIGRFCNANFNGYIDDLRITKGVARYTSNFIPQTAPFPNP